MTIGQKSFLSNFEIIIDLIVILYTNFIEKVENNFMF